MTNRVVGGTELPRALKVAGYVAPYVFAAAVWLFSAGRTSASFEGLPAAVRDLSNRIAEVERIQESQVLVVDTTLTAIERQTEALSRQLGRILCLYDAQQRRDQGQFVSPFACEEPEGG